MNRARKTILSAWLFCLLPAAIHAEICGPIGDAASHRLISYVAKKYKLPPQLNIRLEENGFIADSCYRNVRFFSVASAQFFDLSAVLAPDQVFLVTGADDSRIDPILVQKKLEQARQEELVQGTPPSQGPTDARSKVVVFSDFECPYCKSAVPVLKDALNLETHDVRVIFRSYPLSFHPWAFRAAISARCAAEQSPADFWKLHDFLFDNQSDITPENLDGKARGVLAEIPGFDLLRYGTCLSDESAKKAVQADIDLGTAHGVDGTPSIYVNGRKFAGALTAERLRGFIAAVAQDGRENSTNPTENGSR